MQRALLTENEREAIRGNKPANYRGTVRERLRARIQELETDIELLRENEPEIYHQIIRVSCTSVIEELSYWDIQEEIDRAIQRREEYRDAN